MHTLVRAMGKGDGSSRKLGATGETRRNRATDGRRNEPETTTARPIIGKKSPKSAITRRNNRNDEDDEDDEDYIGIVSQDNNYSVDDDEFEADQLTSLERIASVPRFRSVSGPHLQQLSTPELTWLSERLPGRYQYNRRPSRSFDRGEHIRFLLQLKSWMSHNSQQRTRFSDEVEIINDDTENSAVERIREEPPPRHPGSGRRHRAGADTRRQSNRQRLNNNSRVYFPSPDPAQEILSLSDLELGRLARRDTTWLAGLCAALIAKYPTLHMQFNDRDPMSILSTASNIRGRLDPLRTPLPRILPNTRNSLQIGIPQSNTNANLQVNRFDGGYPPHPPDRHPQIGVQNGSYLNPTLSNYGTPTFGILQGYPQPTGHTLPYAHNANTVNSVGFHEGVAIPSNQSTSTWNGLPLASPEEVGIYPGLGTARPTLLVQNRLGASILRQFLLDGQNIELFTRQRFADLRTKDREPSTQAFAEAVSLARTIHFIIHMFGNTATALRQCDALEISLRRLWVLVEVEQACFNGTTRKNAWKTYGVLLEHTVHGQQSNSVVHQLVRRDFYTMERFSNAVGRMRPDSG